MRIWKQSGPSSRDDMCKGPETGVTMRPTWFPANSQCGSWSRLGYVRPSLKWNGEPLRGVHRRGTGCGLHFSKVTLAVEEKGQWTGGGYEESWDQDSLQSP